MAETVEGHVLEQRVLKVAETHLKRTEVEAVLADFARKNSLPPMTFDEDSSLALTVDEEFEVKLVHMPNFPGVLALVELPQEVAVRHDITRPLLQANLSWPLTGGGTFAKLPEGGPPVFCRRISLAERDEEAFSRELGQFVDRAQEWLDEIVFTVDLPPGDANDDADPAAPVATPD